MSTPTNPLSKFSTYQVRHVLAAFKYTEDAENVNLTKSSGKVGDAVSGGFIIVNEFEDDRFMLPSVIWDWRKIGPSGPTTTGMTGALDIADRSGGQFIDWFRSEIIGGLGTSASQMTFALKTYFMGTDRIIGNDKYIVITGNQLIFHVHNFNEIMNADDKDATRVRLLFSGAYNTTAQTPLLSKPFQVTLTHIDGNLNNIQPETFAPSSGIMTRADEDGMKSEPRLTRMEKSKPMKTLKDAFDAFEFELNQQQSVHKRQVQTWIEMIRNDYELKIDPPPKQQRGDKLPIQFHVELDPLYHPYELDNRNLPFEQVNEDPDIAGVTSIPFRAGASIVEMVETIMKYSRQVGHDAAKPPLYTSFKTNISHMRKRDDKVHVYIKVKQITLALNTQDGVNSGPGEGALDPLEFIFKAGNTEDFDITYLKTSIFSDSYNVKLEDGPRKAVYGDRETFTAERMSSTASGTEFFKTEHSGFRTPIIPYLNGGLEDGVAGCRADLSNMSTGQTTSNEMQIAGNSSLMYDLQRLPSQAATIGNVGNAECYMMPETLPMYLKVKIYIGPSVVKLVDGSDNPPEKYFYDNHYEIVGVVNNMIDGAFYQHITLNRTDDIV